MNIAILGWGSLLWDERPEFDGQHGDWKFDGPVVPLEFSRVSKSRGGTLTLVIDEVNGTPVPVAWCVSSRSLLMEVVTDLRDREGTNMSHIGRVVCSDRDAGNHSACSGVIRSWAAAMGLDAVAWTALPSNFVREKVSPYSPQAAIEHVKGLDSPASAQAIEYIRRAPAFVRTPLREVIEREPWFMEHSHEHSIESPVG